MYTTSSLFLRTLAQVGITHAFVNWGSDHPALLEEIERQRIEEGEVKPKIVTCPNEMVALSAAQGYAQVTGRPAAVIVHVDVGTQALAGAVHNADKGRVPVLIYAGASAFTGEGELKGSRNEWIMWMQDAHDQSAIVRQYMRYTAQINSPRNLTHVVRRALQIATSEPRGPTYLWGRREVMEEEIDGSLVNASSSPLKWPSVEPSGLSASAAEQIATALLSAAKPLLLTSHAGRNTRAPSVMLDLCSLLAIPIFSTCPSAVNVPFSCPLFTGVSFLAPGTQTPLLKDADVVLVVDAEVAWIPMNKDSNGVFERPNGSARVFVLDGGDPLRENLGMHHLDAEMVCRADAEVALRQIAEAARRIDTQGRNLIGGEKLQRRATDVQKMHDEWVAKLNHAEAFDFTTALHPHHYTVPQILSVLRSAIVSQTPSKGANTIVLNESISNYPLPWSHMQPNGPGAMIGSGGSSLGWALGASIGAILGARVEGKGSQRQGYDLVTTIVGDGTFLFGVPASAFWIARRYQTPFLTVILNNGGWKSPKLSMLGVHANGHGSKAMGDQLTVGFGPDMPDYSQIAVAASGGWAWGKRISADTVAEGKDLRAALEEVIVEAVRIVVQEGRCAVVDCILEKI